MIEDNVITYYKGLTHALEGEFHQQERLVWFATGRKSLPRFNGILRLQASADDLEAVSGPVLEHFFANQLPFFWADSPPGATPGLREYLQAHSVPLAASGMPAMTRSLLEIPAIHLPQAVEITAVDTSHDQADWLEVLMLGFPEPEEARPDFQQLLSRTLAGSPAGWQHFLARWQGVACAVSTLVCAREAAGIYHVATLPAYRGRGLGKALTLAAMAAARHLGYDQAVLFATPSGYPLYRKLGYTTVVTGDLYIWDGVKSGG